MSKYKEDEQMEKALRREEKENKEITVLEVIRIYIEWLLKKGAKIIKS